MIARRSQRVRDGAIGANKQRALALGVTRLNHQLTIGHAGVARPDEPMVTGEKILDVARDLDPRGDEDHEIVTHAFDVGDQMRARAAH